MKTLRKSALLLAATLITAVACRSKEPKLSVFLPESESRFTKGDTIHFASELNSDLDPGRFDSTAWQWISDRDGEIGRGPRLDLTTLSVGRHEVTAIVRHRIGISEDHVTVFVDSAPASR